MSRSAGSPRNVAGSPAARSAIEGVTPTVRTNEERSLSHVSTGAETRMRPWAASQANSYQEIPATASSSASSTVWRARGLSRSASVDHSAREYRAGPSSPELPLDAGTEQLV